MSSRWQCLRIKLPARRGAPARSRHGFPGAGASLAQVHRRLRGLTLGGAALGAFEARLAGGTAAPEVKRDRQGGRPITCDPASVPRNPLDWLVSTHAEWSRICALLERLAEGAAVPAAELWEAAEFVRVMLPIHLLDEEVDLFPLLRHRCTDADSIELVLGLLGAEHDEEADRVTAVLGLLGQDALTPRQARTLAAFVREQRRHLAVEEALVVPMARKRLGRRDLTRLRKRMLARRAAASGQECGLRGNP